VDSIAEGLWTFTQPFPIPMVGDPDLRMTVATLGDGTLLVGALRMPRTLSHNLQCGIHAPAQHVLVNGG